MGLIKTFGTAALIKMHFITVDSDLFICIFLISLNAIGCAKHIVDQLIAKYEGCETDVFQIKHEVSALIRRISKLVICHQSEWMLNVHA